MANKRTFGWVQNPSDLKSLKRVVGAFVLDSDSNKWLKNVRLPLLKQYHLIEDDLFDEFISQLDKKNISIKYDLLRGKGSGSGSRKDALCSGIIQAIIDGQRKNTYTDSNGQSTKIKKPYVDNWTSEGYLRWAIACGLVKYDDTKDVCEITELGIELVETKDDSPEQKDVLTRALLSYPPVIRILSLLEKKDEQTKFELGSQLGFKGELGFSSIPEEIFLCDYCEATTKKEKSEVRSNTEGDSDKYARGIASWCIKMGWVATSKKDVTGVYRNQSYTSSMQVYTITRAGEKALIKSRGRSSKAGIPKILLFQMLASNKASGADYLRYLRASIVKSLEVSPKTLEQIQASLKANDLKDIDTSSISDSIEGLKNIGLEIVKKGNKYRLLDKIEGLYLPPRNTCVKDEVNEIKDRVRTKLVHLNHKYLVLIDLSYSDADTKAKKNADAREFEIQTAELFTNELSFEGMRLGDSNKPDVIISYGKSGTIIDNKSYKDGFNINTTSKDEMIRYINQNTKREKKLNSNEWWLNFNPQISTFTFLFITSFLKGRFEEQLKYISEDNNDMKGAAIGVESLLYLSEGIKKWKNNSRRILF